MSGNQDILVLQLVFLVTDSDKNKLVLCISTLHIGNWRTKCCFLPFVVWCQANSYLLKCAVFLLTFLRADYHLEHITTVLDKVHKSMV